MPPRWQSMTSHRANHVFHVRSAARAHEAQPRHRSVSRLASPQESDKERRSLTPAPFEKCHASTGNHYHLALPSGISLNRRRQRCQNIRRDNIVCLLGDGLQVGVAIRSGIEPTSGCHLTSVSAPEAKVARRSGECSDSCKSKPGGMVNVGNTTWLDEPSDLLQGGAPDHHGGCNNEVEVDQGGKDGSNWIVSRDPSARRVPEATVDTALFVHESCGAVSEHHRGVIEQRKFVFKLCGRPRVVAFEDRYKWAPCPLERRRVRPANASDPFMLLAKDDDSWVTKRLSNI